MEISFIGAGNAGTALALAFAGAGHSVVAVYDSDAEAARLLASRLAGCRVCSTAQEACDAAEAVFITTCDDAICVVAGELNWRRGQSALHCGGALTVRALDPAAEAGARVGSFHPLRSLRDAAAAALEGCRVAVEAGPELMPVLEALARDVRARPVRIRSGDKVLYHAAASIAGNFIISLLDVAAGLLQAVGFERGEAQKALAELAAGAVRNIERSDTAGALTGPIARGDVGTVAAHIEALAREAPQALELYKQCALFTIALARRKGTLGDEPAAEMTRLLAGAGEQADEIHAQE